MISLKPISSLLFLFLIILQIDLSFEQICYQNSSSCEIDFQNAFPQCIGRYCGRPTDLQGQIISFTCGSCPNGYRSDGWACLPCDKSMELYTCFYLLFMYGLLLLYFSHLYDKYVDDVFPKRVILYVITLGQTIVSAVLSVIIVSPTFSMVVVCPLSSFYDWYPFFLDPSLNYTCANETSYPLYSMVFYYLFISILLYVLVQLPVTIILLRSSTSIKESYRDEVSAMKLSLKPLFFYPILFVCHFLFAGLIYFAFPYFSLILMTIMNFIHIYSIISEPREQMKTNYSLILKRIFVFFIRICIMIWSLITVFLFFDISPIYYLFALLMIPFTTFILCCGICCGVFCAAFPIYTTEDDNDNQDIVQPSNNNDNNQNNNDNNNSNVSSTHQAEIVGVDNGERSNCNDDSHGSSNN